MISRKYIRCNQKTIIFEFSYENAVFLFPFRHTSGFFSIHRVIPLRSRFLVTLPFLAWSCPFLLVNRCNQSWLRFGYIGYTDLKLAVFVGVCFFRLGYILVTHWENRDTKGLNRMAAKTKQKQSIPVPTENQEAIALADWLRENELVFLHVPNEGLRSAAMGSLLLRMGLQPGFPDYLILSKSRACPRGAYIELKRRKGGTTPDKQRAWHMTLEGLAIRGTVAHGAREAVGWLRQMGYGSKANREQPRAPESTPCELLAMVMQCETWRQVKDDARRMLLEGLGEKIAAYRSIACPICGAQEGARCWTSTGLTLTKSHSLRALAWAKGRAQELLENVHE